MLTIAGDGFVIVDRTTGALDGRPKLAFSVGSEAVGRCGAPAVAATAAIDGVCARAETVLWMPVDWPKVRLLVAGTAEATGATVDRAMAATAMAAPKRAVARRRGLLAGSLVVFVVMPTPSLPSLCFRRT